MHRGSLHVCVVAALLFHAALIWGVARSPVSGAASRAPRPVAVMQLVKIREEAAVPEEPAPLDVPTLPVPVAQAVEAASSPSTVRTEPAPAVRSVAPEEAFRSPQEVERLALPRSAPDVKYLAGLTWSGLPMRLRLFIDATGVVVDVKVLDTNDTDEVCEHVRQMFLATGFVPAREGGVDVASYKDVELNVGNVR